VEARQRDEGGGTTGRVDVGDVLASIDTSGEVGGGGRQDVASGEGRARRREVVLGIGEGHDPLRTAEDGDGRREEPVVGPEEGSLLDLYRHEASVGADAGVHDTQDDAAVREVLGGS